MGWSWLEALQDVCLDTNRKNKTKIYSYYVTHAKPRGKITRFQCKVVDTHFPDWLNKIKIDPDRISEVREVYKREIFSTTNEGRDDKIAGLKRMISQLREEEARLGRLVITGKMSEETYDQLRGEWEVKLQRVEKNLASMEREVRISIDDLDMALVLLVKLPTLYCRLDQKQQVYLLQILAKRIIVNDEGAIIGQELNSSFIYLRAISESIVSNQPQSSDQIRLGAHESDKTAPTNSVEQFLSLIRFEQRGKLKDLSIDIKNA